jgi:glycogen operon protein
VGPRAGRRGPARGHPAAHRAARAHPALRQRTFFTGRAGADGVKDVGWFGASGREHTEAEWFDREQSTLGMYVDGRQIRTRSPQGEPVVGDSLLLYLHLGPEDCDVVLPGAPWAASYELLLDTAQERPAPRARSRREACCG